MYKYIYRTNSNSIWRVSSKHLRTGPKAPNLEQLLAAEMFVRVFMNASCLAIAARCRITQDEQLLCHARLHNLPVGCSMVQTV